MGKEKHQLLLSSLLGGLGAFLTTFFRFRSYHGSIAAGLPIHRLDGALRIFYGVIASLLVTLAIKGNVLVGFANESGTSQPWIGYFLGMIAGASEILIPNLIKQTEGSLGVKNGHEDMQTIKMKITDQEMEFKVPDRHDKISENGNGER